MNLFLRPEYTMYSVLVVASAALAFFLSWRNDRRARATLHPTLLQHGRRADHQRRTILLTAAGLLLAVALIGPSWGTDNKPDTRIVRDIYLAVDISRSMRATDVAPDRLSRVRQAVASLTQKYPGYRYDLILFAANAWLRVPLTWDHDFINEVLAEADPEDFHPQGTDLKKPLQMVVNHLQKEELDGGTVVLITDGEHNGPGSPFDIVPALNSHHVRIIAIGAGNPEGAPVPLPGGGYAHDASGDIVFSKPDFETLSQLAKATDGIALRLDSDNLDWNPIGTALQTIETRKKKQTQHLQQIDRTPWFVFAALLFMLAAAIPWPVRFGKISLWLVLIVITTGACTEREGFDAYKDHDYKKAASVFARDAASGKDAPALNNLGASLHQLENYPVAVSAFLLAATRQTDTKDKADSLYNAGNALFRAGDLQRAIGTWKASLSLREDEDTRVNLEVAKRLLKKRQQKAAQPKRAQESKKEDGKKKSGGKKAQLQKQKPGKEKKNAKDKKAGKKKKSGVLLQKRMDNLKEGRQRTQSGSGGDSAQPW